MLITCDLKTLVVIFTIINALFASSNYFNKIFYGGVGKNGSSVAVSLMNHWKLCNLLGLFIKSPHELTCFHLINNLFLWITKVLFYIFCTNQIPMSSMHVQLKQLPLAITIFNEFLILLRSMNCIFKGGVGKNGSTVAVS
jgi:hypothetical protein